MKHNNSIRSIHHGFAALAVLTGIAGTSAAANILAVPATYPTIMAAVNAATSGDIIRFSSPGTYPSTASTLVKNLVFVSAGGQVIITPPVSGGRVFTISSGVNVTFDHVTISGGALTGGANRGAGILNNGNATLTNCTLSGNSSGASGGAIYNSASGFLSLANCTLAGNSVAGSGTVGGGAISNGGTVTLTNCTIGNNSSSGVAGGLDNRNNAPFTLKNTLVAANTAGSSPDAAGTFTSQDYNLVGNGSGATFNGATAHNIVGTAGSPVDARLGPLQDNGGESETLALLPGSPAIDAIPGSAPANFPSTDQRDDPRPVDGGDGDNVAEGDIGAFEAAAPTQFYVSPSGSDANTGVTAGQPLRNIVTAVNRVGISGVINVVPGIYAENLALQKSVTIQGTLGAAATTILQPQSTSTTDPVVVIYPATTITLSDLTIRNGNATIDGFGYGGGVFNEGAATLSRCIVSNNGAAYSGGGVVNYVDATMLLADTLVKGNSSDFAAGIENDGTMAMDRCTVSANTAVGGGGGIGNSGALTIVNSTITGNAAFQGGGLYNSAGYTALTNVTISNNSATDGGGIATLTTYGDLQTSSSVIAGNHAASGPDISGQALGSLGFNFIGNGKDCSFLPGAAPSRIGNPANVLDPKLGALADNGGYTPTMNPSSDSPLIDAGPTGAPDPFPKIDQRGIARPIGAKSDIGAVEYQPRFVVTRTADDANTGSLRWAINQANGTSNSVIAFSIPGDGVKTIRLSAGQGGLPVISRKTFVDGWSQGGPNYTGTPLIELDGEDVPTTFGLNLQADGCVVRGLAINRFPNAGQGNGFGIGVFNGGANIWIYGCMLGTDASGTIARGNGQGGIWAAAGGTLIGSNFDGVNDGAEINVISANAFEGILVTSADNAIAGNVIGMDRNTANVLGNGSAVAYGGIRITSGSGNHITRNAIAGNKDLGIDLGGDGATPNDPGDDDGGANALQNFPVITNASTTAGTTAVTGTLNSTPGGDFTVELFDNAVAGTGGYGQGRRYLTSTAVHTDNSGNGSFSASVPAVPDGQFIMATATSAAGNTSEFSISTLVSSGFTMADVQRALRLASGMAAYTSADSLLNVITAGGSANSVDTLDCAELARKVGGLDANP